MNNLWFSIAIGFLTTHFPVKVAIATDKKLEWPDEYQSEMFTANGNKFERIIYPHESFAVFREPTIESVSGFLCENILLIVDKDENDGVIEWATECYDGIKGAHVMEWNFE